jgi:hypothetical protein
MKGKVLEKEILERIQSCDEFFEDLRLDQQYSLHYYTLFTKSDIEKSDFLTILDSYFELTNNSNGNMYKVLTGSFLPKHVMYIRVRNPDQSPAVVAGDVIGSDLEKVCKCLDKMNIKYNLIERPDNLLVEIKSLNNKVNIYFPKIHFLNKYF